MIWVATCKDGTQIKQFDIQGNEHQFKEVKDIERLSWVGDRTYTIALKNGEQPIIFRRHALNIKEDKIMSYGLGIKGRFLMLITDGKVEVT
jgi:hypothetical protein